MSKFEILVIHGPNLNTLGKREPEIYGKMTVDQINDRIKEFAANNNITVKIIQSNSEGDIIDFIHKNKADGLVINPAAYTHTSIAIADAIKASGIKSVEVHLSNIHAREEFRKKSFVAPVCLGQISGFGNYSYILGLSALIEYLNKHSV